jgi:hypothetical protein
MKGLTAANFAMLQGQSGFDELRRYMKQGGDFCKELSVILQERSVHQQYNLISYR